jgi:U3 small nucleolar RNA-associated protein 18
MNLTTTLTDLKFGPTGQTLAILSKWKKNAVRLAHIPSYTVFQNFPALINLKYPMCTDFSQSGEFMALGNDAGKTHIFHMPYFSEH